MVLHMYYYNFQSNQTGIEMDQYYYFLQVGLDFQSNQTGIEM